MGVRVIALPRGEREIPSRQKETPACLPAAQGLVVVRRLETKARSQHPCSCVGLTPATARAFSSSSTHLHVLTDAHVLVDDGPVHGGATAHAKGGKFGAVPPWVLALTLVLVEAAPHEDGAAHAAVGACVAPHV